MKKEHKEYLRNALHFNPVKKGIELFHTYSGHVATARTSYVLMITLGVYIPLIILWVFLFCKYNYWSLPFLLVMLLSTLPFAQYVLLHLSERKYPEITNKVYGMESCKDCIYLKKCTFAETYILNNNNNPSNFVACKYIKKH